MMDGKGAEDFLKSFDDNRYPRELTEVYEPIECLSAQEEQETLLLRRRCEPALFVAKCYFGEQRGMGENENAILSVLDYPTLPKYVGCFSGEDVFCVVREYVEGTPLSRLGREELTEARCVGIGAALCDALTYLHSRKPPVIHRDIKPQNVIVCPDGGVKLIDFGISRRYDESAGKDTVCFGTREFAPPEQYGFSQTDRRADIYSLGVLMAWLLTGETDPAKAQFKNTGLERVCRKCAAFAPRDRYSDAAAVKRALTGANKDTKNIAIYVLAAVALLCALAGVGMLKGWFAPKGASAAADGQAVQVAAPSASVFKDAVMERAVRAALNAPDRELAGSDLASVTSLYIVGERCTADEEEFYSLLHDWERTGQVSQKPLLSLEDAAMLPNLQKLCVCASGISDISALEGLNALETLELKGNPVADASVLAKLPRLKALGLNGCSVTDLSPAVSDRLETLDLCDADLYDPAALDKLGDMQFLDVSNSTDSYKHLGGRSIRYLKLNRTGMASLSCLADVSGIRCLYLNGTAITSLDGIEAHTALEELELCETGVTDFSPLLDLTALKTVTVSGHMRQAVEATAPNAAFEVVYVG